MSVLELAIAAAFAAAGVRSLWVWTRRPFEGLDVLDHALYALYLTGRIGLWFAFSGFFVLYALTESAGDAAAELDRLRWYVIVPIGLAALQLLAGYALGRREPDGT